ncbi:DNA-binding protein [Gallibacterium genomosp. 2]|uniref:Transcriptional regulator n=3 Tax=Gallibacterium TaxID=155493 RepID=U1H2U3_9PAST|nr:MULTISPECIES: AlpA family transcriptional regulator [Gallibacterium]ERF78736.1 transcriptional regulator [Gallibacterium anatis 12656/12]KGQ32567.1 DNA-binding protein [Gallibacterium genomosp. 2]KGQ51337.1 DNA-binding protein [Gallibacterium anatis]KGQ53522.1 DNA-binding protein [Gallibacterium anatis]KGQ55184.1 DNA-binding protein [Gallibacterium anatis str. Avicor]
MGNDKERFIRLNEVIKKTGLSKGTIYKYMKDGSFPSNIPISDKVVVWLESEVDQWINSKINEYKTRRQNAIR